MPGIADSRFLVMFIVAFGSLVPAAGADVAIVRTVLSDNGDQDGYADTQETVTLRLVLRNLSDTDLTGLVARATNATPGLACLTGDEIAVGDLAAREERTTDDGFVFVVGPEVERSAVDEALTLALTVHIRSDAGVRVDDSRPIQLDLDLDLAGGDGPTTFFESFENGFGAFTTMHIDEPLNPPDSDIANKPAGVLNADGYRCQNDDPGSDTGGQCFPNPNNVGDAFYFHVVTDRAFSGTQAMAFNVFLDETRGYTTPSSQLEAIRTSDPVNLAWQGACSVTAGACTNDEQCPAGENCVVPQPKLSFKHQVSFVDHRSINNSSVGRTADRGVIGVQLADGDGAPIGPWLKAYPYVNIYDSQAGSNFFHCSFDPVDDGNTEDDFFDPTDSNPYYGPSSTCWPEFVFAHQGDTDDPFDPDSVGKGLPGSGLEGEFGIGTWVEPVVDLSRFRGRRLRVRFLTSQLKLGGAVTWDQFLNYNPNPGDDGWFLDDVRVTHALTGAATVTVDAKDNSHLETLAGDEDDDGVVDACDNCLGLANGDQVDADVDGLGDACDPCDEDPDDDSDGDGICADRDNCAFVANPSQADADRDRIGDVCDACPLVRGDDLDADGDGVTCDVDVCPFVADADQLDEDGDGLGDACDPCLSDPTNDPDDDGVCNGVDTCPLLENAAQDGTIRLVERVGQARLSPDGTRILLFAGLSGDALHSMAATGGSLLRLSSFLHGEVTDFAWTPDGTAAIYYDDNALRRVPVTGGAIQTLATPAGPIAGFTIGPDGEHVVFEVLTDIPAGTWTVFSVPAEGGSVVPLGPPAASGSRSTDAQIAPDGDSVLLYHDPSGSSSGTELHCASIDGTTTARITPPLASSAGIGAAAFDPSGARVVYVAEQETAGVVELFSVPCDGSAGPVKLNGVLREGGSVVSPASGSEPPFAISPDGTTVVFSARPEQGGPVGLFQVPLLGGTATRFAYPSNGFTPTAGAFRFTPDGSAVVNIVDALGPAASRLFLAPLDGSSPLLLHTTDADQDIDGGFAIAADGSRVVLREEPSGEIWSVSLSGAAGVALSAGNPGLPGGELRLSADGQQVLYGGEPLSFGTRFSLYSVPVAGGVDPVQFATGVERIVGWASDGSVAHWIAYWLHASWPEPDADGDGLHVACDCDGPGGGSRVFEEVNDGLDNQCPGDPGFGLVDELAPTLTFWGDSSHQVLVWTPQVGADAHEVVRSTDSDFAAGCACERLQRISFQSLSSYADSEIPDEGQTLYYLVRPASPYQGSAGADSSGVERSGACLAILCVPGSL